MSKLNLKSGLLFAVLGMAVFAMGGQNTYAVVPGAFSVPLSNEAPVCDQVAPIGPAVRLNWGSAPGTTAYHVYRDGGYYVKVNLSTTFYNNAGLIAGNSYTYFILAENGDGTTKSNTITVNIPSNVCNQNTVPLAPSNASATALSSSSIAFIWQDNSNDETDFRIERSDEVTNNEAYSFLANANSIAGSGQGGYYEDTDLNPSTKYCYKVRASNASGYSAFTTEACATTFPLPNITPTVTTGSASNVGGTSATLNGTINPNGVSSGGFFQWGTSVSYGNTTPNQAVGGGTSTVNISGTITNLQPSTTYHYRVVGANSSFGSQMFGTDRTFTTNSDMTTPPQTDDGAWHIRDDATGGECTSIGTWNTQTKTCTLTQDLSQGIIIDSDGVTLDGVGHTITQNNSGKGVSLSGRTGVTIKNLDVHGFQYGIYLNSSSNNAVTGNMANSNNMAVFFHNNFGIYLTESDNNTLTSNITSGNSNSYGIVIASSSNNTLTDNTASDNPNSHGIGVASSNNNTLTGNTVLNNGTGISVESSDGNFLTDNTSSANRFNGIYLFHSNNNTVTGNTAYSKSSGIASYSSSNNIVTNNTSSGIELSTSSNNNHIYNNNFIGNQAFVSTDSGGNVFNLAAPIGGNYWSDFDTPAEGCNDADDNFCDSPYAFSGGQDNLPWIMQDGWLLEQQTATLTVIKEVVNDDGGNKVVTDFPLFITKDSTVTAVASGNAVQANAGTYMVTETNVPGYSASFSNDCDASGLITLASGDNKTCIITNDDIPSENHPPTLSNLLQSSASMPNGISEGSSTVDSTVTFGATVDDLDGGQVRLQIELRQLNELPFSGVEDGGILTSDPVPAGSIATITRSGLLPGAYHWRARAVDVSHAVSEWKKFGAADNFDFRVLSTIVNLSLPQTVLPEVQCSPAKHLVFITHGWNSDVKGWVKDLAVLIKNYINAHSQNPGDWSICTFDWSKGAALENFGIGGLFGFGEQGLPWEVYAKAGVIGGAAGKELARNKYESIHFIGHSAGSNVIQTAAEAVRKDSLTTKVHLTFLDAYDPNGVFSRLGLNPMRNAPSTSQSNWWAEQYVDKRGNPVLSYTNILLPHAYNFDVTALDDAPQDQQQGEGFISYANRVHAWPHVWYQDSVSPPVGTNSDDPLKTYGFKLSLEGGTNSLPLQFLNISPLNVCTFKKDTPVPCFTSQTSIQSNASYSPPFDMQNNLARQSQTGELTFLNPFMAKAKPGSPVWFEIYTTITTTANILHFDYEFLPVAGSEDVLTVFVDDQVVQIIDERITDSGNQTANEISVGDIVPGVHRIGFRLDPFTDSKSAIQISHIQLGLLTTEQVTDTIAPTTTATVSGTLLKNDWHLGTTTVAFTAQDNEGGVGVEKTEYSFDGQVWNEYAQALIIGTEGTTTIFYRSRDFFGNTEDTKTLTLKIVSVKWFLEDALAKLKSIQTGNKDIDKATDSIERDLGKIISDKSWIDRNRLSWPKGLPILINEVGIVRALGDILNKAGQKKNSVPVATQEFYRDAQNEIVQSSALLAKLSFDKAKTIKAKNVVRQKALDRAITRIQKMLDRAAAKEEKKPKQAVRLYGAAWFATETLLKTVGATPFRASDFGELYSAEDMKDLVD